MMPADRITGERRLVSWAAERVTRQAVSRSPGIDHSGIEANYTQGASAITQRGRSSAHRREFSTEMMISASPWRIAYNVFHAPIT